MRGAVVLFLSVYLLRALVAEVNSALSGAHVWIFAGGLFLAYASLMATFRQGLAVAVLAGLLCDALAPVGFGTHAALFAVAHSLVYHFRERLQREETGVRVAVALLVNIGLFAALSFARIRVLPAVAAAWPRLLSDLLISEGAIVLVAPWFFALQASTLELARAPTERSL